MVLFFPVADGKFFGTAYDVDWYLKISLLTRQFKCKPTPEQFNKLTAAAIKKRPEDLNNSKGKARTATHASIDKLDVTGDGYAQVCFYQAFHEKSNKRETRWPIELGREKKVVGFLKDGGEEVEKSGGKKKKGAVKEEGKDDSETTAVDQ